MRAPLHHVLNTADRRRRARLVDCPYCQATPGEPCLTNNGLLEQGYVHVDRLCQVD